MNSFRVPGIVGFVAPAMLILLPAMAEAQVITGVARDATGAVLPGVTVEASSPALIEGSRSAVTDGRGQYRIVDLRPGSYTVVFTLPGFATVRHEGIQLNTGFTAAVNADMRVASLAETVTVSGETPIVDIQNVQTQNVLTREELDTVPIAKTYSSLGALTLGTTHTTRALGHGDVGGSKGETVISLVVHNTGYGLTLIDGMRTSSGYRVPYAHRYIFNQMSVEEIVMETSGVSAESQSGGLNVNMIPKDGGNVFSGSFNTEYTGEGLQNSNFTDELRARGLRDSSKILKIYDIGAGFGGPIKRDALWFYGAYRSWGSEEEIPGTFFNRLKGSLFYEPDFSRPGIFDKYVRDSNLRLTWQLGQSHRIRAYAGVQEYCWCDYGLTSAVAPEAVWVFKVRPNNLFQATWTQTATSRLLFEAGASLRQDRQIAGIPESQEPNARSVLDQETGITYNSGSRAASSDGTYGDMGNQGAFQTRFAVSYVTGSHAFKAGVQTLSGQSGRQFLMPPHAIQYTFDGRTPVAVRQLAVPHSNKERTKIDLGIYAQDQWTIRQLTLNMGVRFDHLNSYVPEQIRPAGQFAPAFHIDQIDDVPNFKDVNARLGAAYDLFGNGRTAIKASAGRYVQYDTTGLTDRVNPANAISHTTERSWTDANVNYVPDCDLTDRAANGECGPMENQLFGTIGVQNRFADDVLRGWHVRPANWQISAAIQHELRQGIGVSVGYFRTWWQNLTVTDNLAVASADFDEFCITAPTDPRLPGGGGNQICGLYEVRQDEFGQVDNLEVQYDDFGGRSQVYDGVEIGLSARYGQGGMLNAGVSFGQTVDNQCNAPDLTVTLGGAQVPREWCETKEPFRGQAQLKINGSYPLPWGLQSSFTYQNLPGIPIQASYVARNADVAASLGRPLNAGFTVVELIEPNTVFEPRYNLLDVRLAKVVRIGQVRLQPRFDIYNLLNSNAVIAQLNRYGGAWRRPNDIYQGRMYKFGFQLNF